MVPGGDLAKVMRAVCPSRAVSSPSLVYVKRAVVSVNLVFRISWGRLHPRTPCFEPVQKKSPGMISNSTAIAEVMRFFFKIQVVIARGTASGHTRVTVKSSQQIFQSHEIQGSTMVYAIFKAVCMLSEFVEGGWGQVMSRIDHK